mmetsp:Transcript_16494/g.45368  ORF Transcript_16494/g.45368 Transcript_16494/m.45368 type:complete len:335 (-) Transcript_16494:75-1079(-)
MSRTMLVQTLVVRGGQVLLGRWRAGSGPFEGMLTGLIGQAGRPAGQPPPRAEALAAAVCTELLGPGVQVDPRRLRRRALMQFEERDASSQAAETLGNQYEEHELVLRLGPEEAQGGTDLFEPVATKTFEPFGWFGPNDIPYDMMPADDRVWYEKVLYEDKRLRGQFAFKGTELVEHSLQEVSSAEGLCDLDADSQSASALLVHNPACSKSQALEQALKVQGIPFRVRRYLEDPLSLSELETLLARLKASPPAGGSFNVDDLCRDRQLVSRVRMANLFRDGFLRSGGPGLADEDVLLEKLAQEPELLQRPILVYGLEAALGRPQPGDALRILAKS